MIKNFTKKKPKHIIRKMENEIPVAICQLAEAIEYAGILAFFGAVGGVILHHLLK